MRATENCSREMGSWWKAPYATPSICHKRALCGRPRRCDGRKPPPDRAIPTDLPVLINGKRNASRFSPCGNVIHPAGGGGILSQPVPGRWSCIRIVEYIFCAPGYPQGAPDRHMTFGGQTKTPQRHGLGAFSQQKRKEKKKTGMVILGAAPLAVASGGAAGPAKANA